MATRTDAVAMPTLSAGNGILTAHKAVANRIRQRHRGGAAVIEQSLQADPGATEVADWVRAQLAG